MNRGAFWPPAYGEGMARTPLRRIGRLVVIGLVIAAIARALGRARTRSDNAGAVRPTSGDTWPPVPVNADRRLNLGAWEAAEAP